MLEQHNRHLVRGVALLVFDLYHFKRINDTYGHHVGDRGLVRVTEAMRAEVRESDVPIRLGGEELAIFTIMANTDQAVIVAERIGQRIQALRFEGVSSGGLITASAGVVMHRHGEGLSDLLLRADNLLYEAKAAGRNRIVAEHSDSATNVVQPARHS